MLNALKWKKTIITPLFLLACAPCLIWFETTLREAGAQRPQAGDPNLIDAGKRHFEAHCAACHGADGKGGERGPDIVSPENARRRSADDLSELIRRGIPAGGMPAFQLSVRELKELIAFVRSLSAPAIESAVAGDAAAGAAFFFGKGNCSSCHMVKGRGGLLGPDLSDLAAERTLPEIEQSLRAPSARITPGFSLVSARLHDGRIVRGFVRNESNYDLQLQSLDGKFHLLPRQEVAELVRETTSLMPELKANEEEARNLLAYLSRLSGVALAGEGSVPGSTSNSSSATTESPGGISFAEIVEPRTGDWPTYHGHLSGNRHSPLRQIHVGNVSQLAPKWIFSIPNVRRLECTPVVVDGVMYLTTANRAYALDAQSGRQIWRYQRPLTKGLVGDAAGAINRGVAVLGDKVFMVTDHAHLIALHRLNGRLLWDVEMADYREHYGATSAPLVVKDLVISGISGGDEGVRGFLAAYRASTGERVWRFWTIPAPGAPLSETWVGNALPHGCATTWLTGTYDAKANLLYWTTGNPCPDYNGDERKGDNLYSDSVLALEAETGKLRWYYQFTPHDLHDWDAQQTPMLIDAEFQGRQRQLLVQANRNGFFYVLDRITGGLLLAKPFVERLTWASGIGTDGRPQLLSGGAPTPAGVKACPAVEGATNWMSTAYNPETGLFYVMALEKCVIYSKSPEPWERGKSFYGGATREAHDEPGRKFLRAIEAQTGKIIWQYPQIGPGDSWGGALSTSGGVVFFGDDSGAFAATEAKSGKLLWYFHTNELWKASPMTYLAGGKQYVAVAAGSNILAFGAP
ncbi:MAG TPA: PQQ-dependent dehydrogenase, methanol/ethanol family [Blastocatellia bacterium]|jgi:PQQ-dependent dehydrogenase (methanol/ethanol family)|nr:PQQ-dependent dehydrogenase, methanol/ethanol family [Blastocatellia bacterium]